MKRKILYFALVLILSPFSQTISHAESTWEFNERHLGMESIIAEASKKSVAAKKEQIEKCDAEFDACQKRVLKARQACESAGDACIQEHRRKKDLCVKASEECEKAEPEPKS